MTLLAANCSRRKRFAAPGGGRTATLTANGDQCATDKTIATIDESGVALAAIQGLNAKLEAQVVEKDSEIAQLKAWKETLEQKLQAIEAKLSPFPRSTSTARPPRSRTGFSYTRLITVKP